MLRRTAKGGNRSFGTLHGFSAWHCHRIVVLSWSQVVRRLSQLLLHGTTLTLAKLGSATLLRSPPHSTPPALRPPHEPLPTHQAS